MQYIRPIDGIRGLAVILVMLFHFGYFAPGWIGVQLFFVLSGYLITRILLENSDQRFSARIGRFYWRRALRILPVLIVILLFSTLLYTTTGHPVEYGRDWHWIAAFMANFARLREGDLGPFHVHMWSLAVEEQFYLLWPFAVLLVSSRNLKILVIATLLLSPILRFGLFEAFTLAGFSADYAGKAVYVLPFTQFDAFAAGAALAVWPTLFAKHLDRLLMVTLSVAALAGLSVLAWNHFFEGGAFLASFGYSMYLLPSYGYVWGYSVLNLLFVLIICGTVRSHSWSLPFSSAPLVEVGKISYGVYVYHLPLLVMSSWIIPVEWTDGSNLGRFIYFVCWLAATIAVAFVSFRYIEQPILQMKDRGLGKPFR
jgi:peptidoglycan/LPS O-acetylase OafA/YrhL